MDDPLVAQLGDLMFNWDGTLLKGCWLSSARPRLMT